MSLLSIKVPIWKKYGSLFYDPPTYLYFYVWDVNDLSLRRDYIIDNEGNYKVNQMANSSLYISHFHVSSKMRQDILFQFNKNEQRLKFIYSDLPDKKCLS